jgi:large subunit ribosomal protein L15
MKLNELKAPGARTAPKRKGRGVGSGNGKTGGHGHKGQNARAGGGVRLGFEGGQMPLYRRLPKRGFNNKRFGTRYAVVNVGDLNQFRSGSTVTTEVLVKARLVTAELDGVRILGFGELTKKLKVKVTGFSATAREKIEKAGGTVEEV